MEPDGAISPSDRHIRFLVLIEAIEVFGKC